MLERLSIRQKFSILLFTCLLTFACCALVVSSTLSAVRVNGPLYQELAQGSELVADILPPPGYLAEPYLVTLELAQATDSAHQETLAARLTQLHEQYVQHVQCWEGTGRGLHIAPNIVYQLLGGSIALKDSPGSGAEFGAQLPIVSPTAS